LFGSILLERAFQILSAGDGLMHEIKQTSHISQHPMAMAYMEAQVHKIVLKT
jgi:hypothetical protein